MAEYIERGAVLKKMQNWHTEERLRDCVKDFPAADVEPVKHRRWIYKPHENDEAVWLYHCSECNAVSAQAWNYCRECGAKMGVENGWVEKRKGEIR